MDDFQKYEEVDFSDLKSLLDYFEKVHKETDAYYSQVGDKGMEKVMKTPWGNSPVFHQLSGAYEHESARGGSPRSALKVKFDFLSI